MVELLKNAMHNNSSTSLLVTAANVEAYNSSMSYTTNMSLLIIELRHWKIVLRQW